MHPLTKVRVGNYLLQHACCPAGVVRISAHVAVGKRNEKNENWVWLVRPLDVTASQDDARSCVAREHDGGTQNLQNDMFCTSWLQMNCPFLQNQAATVYTACEQAFRPPCVPDLAKMSTGQLQAAPPNSSKPFASCVVLDTGVDECTACLKHLAQPQCSNASAATSGMTFHPLPLRTILAICWRSFPYTN